MISIIVPIFNAAEYLTDCVDSILGQTTMEPLQIILVDDNSTDKSLAIAQAYAKKHAEDPRRQILLLTQPHSGQSIARNFGLRHAEGEYIAFVDADDRIAPDWCDRHLAAIKGVDYVQSGYRRTSDALTDTGWRVGIRRLPKHQYNYTSPCMRLYRRSALRGLQFEGGMIYEDVIFSTELWLSGAKCKRINYAGYLYTKNPTSTTSVPHPDAQKRVLDELQNRIPRASWKGKIILWYTIFRLKIHFIMEVRKQMDPDFVSPKHAAIALLMMACCIAPSYLSTVSAATYFASPDGAGDGSSYTQPTNFNSGVGKLKSPGDTLYLLGGTYFFTDKYSINKQGSSSKRIVISGYPGEKAVLDFRKVPYGTRGITVHANSLYVHIKNLSIAYSGKNNLYNEGSYCLFENLDIYGSADTGCQMKKGGNNIILNVDSHDNFDYKTMSGNTANFGGNADGFADKQFTGAGNHYIGCRAWGNSDDGWDFFQRISNTQTIIENCVCYQNGPAFYNMKDHPRYETDKAWFDSKVGTQMTDRYNQTITVTLEKYPCQGNGNGFKMGGQYTDHKILIHHCLAVANNARGFDQNNNGGTMWVYNNTAYANTVNFGFTTAYGTNYIQNNVSLSGKNADQPKSQTNVTNDHNTWNNGFGCKNSDFQSLDTTEILAARQADGSLAEGTFMRLNSGSELINAGIDVNLGYNGTAPDLGCYETAGERHDPIPDDTIPEVQPEGTHSVAFVTIPKSTEDKALLSYLRKNDSLWLVETDATDPKVDYSQYEVIVLGGKPNSSAVGFTPLKGYDKPIVLLKPFLLKAGVWNWGDAINTQDMSITVKEPNHPLFNDITVTDGQLQLFSECNTNAVTAISKWTNTSGFDTIATPLSQTAYTTIADFPAGTKCNNTVLPKRMIMIGVSEYSTAFLTYSGKRLIENAICLLLGIPNTHKNDEQGFMITPDAQHARGEKFLHEGRLYIRVDGQTYDITGNKIY